MCPGLRELVTEAGQRLVQPRFRSRDLQFGQGTQHADDVLGAGLTEAGVAGSEEGGTPRWGGAAVPAGKSPRRGKYGEGELGQG